MPFQIDEATMLQLVALTIAVVEGVKQFNLPERVNMVITVLVGSGLAAIAEFAPTAWIRIMPILMVGLAAAGLYSIGKRAGNAVLSR